MTKYFIDSFLDIEKVAMGNCVATALSRVGNLFDTEDAAKEMRDRIIKLRDES